MVLDLANRFRTEQGIDCQVDQHFLPAFPPESWMKWMRDQIKEADYVLMVCKNVIKAIKDERRQRFNASFEQAKWLALNDIFVTEGNPHILDIDKQYQNITPENLSCY